MRHLKLKKNLIKKNFVAVIQNLTEVQTYSIPGPTGEGKQRKHKVRPPDFCKSMINERGFESIVP